MKKSCLMGAAPPIHAGDLIRYIFVGNKCEYPHFTDATCFLPERVSYRGESCPDT